MSDAALEQIINGAVKHFCHFFQLGLGDVAMNHPVVNGLAGDSQRLCNLLNGKFAAASFCVDIRIEQFKELLSCNLLLALSNCNYDIPKMSKCKVKQYPN